MWEDMWGVWRVELRLLVLVRLEVEGDEASRPVQWGREKKIQ